MSSIQNFFDQYPAIAGILVFVILAIVVCLGYFLVFRNWSKRTKIKQKKQKKSKDNFEISSEAQKSEKTEDVQPITYYIVNFDKNGELFIKNKETKEITKSPTKEKFMWILVDENSKLVLPAHDIEILINQEVTEEKKEKFITSEKVYDKDLFIFNLFLRFMEENQTPWAKSKFI